MQNLQMNWFRTLEVYITSLCSIVSINLIDLFHSIQPDLRFLGQTIIGVLTIVYLIKKIKNKK
jgi:hypothetical protein